jgi:hypothetical protein
MLAFLMDWDSVNQSALVHYRERSRTLTLWPQCPLKSTRSGSTVIVAASRWR